jgi:hypothetical protein
MDLRNVGILLPKHCTASQHRRPELEQETNSKRKTKEDYTLKNEVKRNKKLSEL